MAEPAADGFEPAVNLSPLAQTGQLAFDILVEEKSEDARFLIKVDSGWPALSFVQIDPPVGEWTRWAVRLNQLQPNDTETGQVNLNRVINPFVFEVAAGTAKVKLNNIAYECLAECAPQAILSGQSERIDAPHSVFDDAIDANWDLGLGIYETAAGHVTATVVGAEESGRGQVIDVRFGDSAASGIAFIQASTTRDMSALAGGILSFDIRVLDYGAASAMAVRADCQYPCSSGDMDLGMVGAGGWETVEIPVADLTAGGLDLTKVNTPFVISPSWESQAGVHLQLDNIRYRLP